MKKNSLTVSNKTAKVLNATFKNYNYIDILTNWAQLPKLSI